MRNKKIVSLLSFIFSFFVFSTYYELNIPDFSGGVNESMETLDPSWVLALNYANAIDLEWGKDIVFTYGPLGYLNTRLGWQQNKYVFLLFDIFFFVNYFLIFFSLLKESKNYWFTLIQIFLFCLLIPTFVWSTSSMVGLIFVLFWISKLYENPKWFYFMMIISLLLLQFYIKANTSIVSFILFVAAIVLIYLKHKFSFIKLISFIALPIVIVFCSLVFFNLNLKGYLSGSLEMITGYNKIMYLEGEYGNYFLIAMIVWGVLLFLFARNYFSEKNKIHTLIYPFLFFATIFVISKQAFVRADKFHMYEFFNYVPLLIIVFSPYLHKYFNFSKIATTIAIVICFYFSNDIKSIDLESRWNKSNYIKGFSSFGEQSASILENTTNKLPDSILKKIENKTIDAIPWNLIILFENNLNYHPRPIIQSYSVYTKKLQDLNFEHYNSKNSPEFVLFDLESIDKRYPMFDEPKTFLSLIYNYKAIETVFYHSKKQILFQKKNDFKPLSFELVEEYAITNGKVVPEKGYYYEAEIYPNFKGKIVSFLSHEPRINLQILPSKNNMASFKTSSDLLKGGFFYHPYIRTIDDFWNFVHGIENDKINLLTIQPKDQKYYKEKIRIKKFKIIQQ